MTEPEIQYSSQVAMWGKEKEKFEEAIKKFMVEVGFDYAYVGRRQKSLQIYFSHRGE